MKERIIDRINYIPPYGVKILKESKQFNDNKFIEKENLYQYRLSKIIIFKGQNNSILGIQSFYINKNDKEIPGEEGYDKSINALETIKFDIPSNDYLTNMNIWVDENFITKIKFETKRGKEFIVGEGGEEKKLSCLNKSKENMILALYGAYKNQLELLSCKYINKNDYFGNIWGYFELRIKLRDKKFKNTINSNLQKYNDSDKILLSACLLPDSCFNELISFCVNITH